MLPGARCVQSKVFVDGVSGLSSGRVLWFDYSGRQR
jgi:hypothetical protein